MSQISVKHVLLPPERSTPYITRARPHNDTSFLLSLQTPALASVIFLRIVYKDKTVLAF